MINEKIEKALEVAFQYAQTDGGMHKAWVIDQMVRELIGDKYDEWIKEYCKGEDGDNTYDWDIGIAP